MIKQSNNEFSGGAEIDDDDLPSNIPDELKQHNWCVWKFENRNGKRTKIPLMQRQVSSLNQTIKVHGPVMKQQLMPKVLMG